jgi:hypothetical protein
MLGVLGFVGLSFVSFYYKKIESDIDYKLSELEKEE